MAAGQALRPGLGTFDLARLVGPVAPDAFLADAWERETLVLERGNEAYYAELLSLEDVDRILTTTDLRYPAIRMVKDGAAVPLGAYTADVPWGSGTFSHVADVERVLGLYAAGTTIVLQALHRSWPAVRDMCRYLEARLGHRVQTNLYLTPPAAQGFSPHYDTHEVFVLQLAGSKRWRLYDRAAELPLRSQRYDVKQHAPGPVRREVTLRSGDMIYMPRGVVHEAETSDDLSLHLTVGVPTTTWIDVFEVLVAACRRDVRFRRSLPVGFLTSEGPGEEAREAFGALVEAFAGGASLDTAHARLASRFVSTRLPRLDGRLLELGVGGEIALETPFRRRPGVLYRVVAGATHVELAFHGKRVRLPAFVEPTLRHLAAAARFTPADLPGVLDEPGRLVLVRRLAGEGFLVRAD